tara:strand:+ start:159 stop:320 length:162 start_codon:yes stop_codon:yes gene_type:complete
MSNVQYSINCIAVGCFGICVDEVDVDVDAWVGDYTISGDKTGENGIYSFGADN